MALQKDGRKGGGTSDVIITYDKLYIITSLTNERPDQEKEREKNEKRSG
jgi:hypothetical protein